MSTIAVTNLKHESASGNNITLDSSGNVGVGVSTPGYSIDALSSGSVVAQFKRNATGGGSGGIRFGNNDKQFTLYADSSNGMTVYDGGTERMRIDSSGNLLFNSGYGSVATAYGCRAWVNFNGTGTVAIRASGNVSSITDHGTGNYSVNFTTALPDGNYTVTGMTCAEGGESDTREMCVNMNQAFNQTTCGVLTTYQNATRTDRTQVHIAVFR